MQFDPQKLLFLIEQIKKKSTLRDDSIWLGISGCFVLYHMSKRLTLQTENPRGWKLF